jgi:hypothetical protein
MSNGLHGSAKPQPSKLMNVVDIPFDKIVLSPENPNKMDEAEFDELVDGIIKEGFDEPILVVPQLGPDGKETGKYINFSGEHRYKGLAVAAARPDAGNKVFGWTSIPAIVKQGWDDDKRKINLVRRNFLRGRPDPEKTIKIFTDLKAKGYNDAVLRLQMGFTKQDSFDRMFKQVRQALPAEQKKKLDEAKEEIKSIDDLSGVVNKLFTEHGSTMSQGYMVFSLGGKKHHYYAIDGETEKMLCGLEERIQRRKIDAATAFKELLAKVDGLKTPPKKTILRQPKKV